MAGDLSISTTSHSFRPFASRCIITSCPRCSRKRRNGPASPLAETVADRAKHLSCCGALSHLVRISPNLHRPRIDTAASGKRGEVFSLMEALWKRPFVQASALYDPSSLSLFRLQKGR